MTQTVYSDSDRSITLMLTVTQRTKTRFSLWSVMPAVGVKLILLQFISELKPICSSFIWSSALLHLWNNERSKDWKTACCLWAKSLHGLIKYTDIMLEHELTWGGHSGTSLSYPIRFSSLRLRPVNSISYVVVINKRHKWHICPPVPSTGYSMNL